MPILLADCRLLSPEVLVAGRLRAQQKKRPAASAPAWHSNVRTALRTMHPRQEAFIHSRRKRRIARVGRRGGKTTGFAVDAVEQFLAGKRVLYAVPTQEQIDRFWFEIKQPLASAIVAGHVYKNETRHLIELPGTETRIRAKTAWNADTMRGDYADVLILDEYQLMNEDAWGVVGAPMLIDNGGEALFGYTPPSFRSLGASKARDPRHAAKLYATAARDAIGLWLAATWTSYDNPHLSAEGLATVMQDMTVTALRQEIGAEDIEDVPGALWTTALLDRTRVSPDAVPEFVRVGVALDPAATSSETADEMGIVAGGVGTDGHGYMLRDASLRGTPEVCARQAIFVYDTLQADIMVGEANNGGEWIGTTIRMVAEEWWRKGERTTCEVNYKMVHASRGKQTRAEPVAALFARERCHHVGVFPELEEQQTTWVPGMRSPDRMDAAVWLWTELSLHNAPPPPVVVPAAIVTQSRWRF